MTNHLSKSAKIVGLPASKLKAAILSWERSGKGVEELSCLREVAVQPGVAAALMGEAWLRGMIDFVDEHWAVAENGSLGPTREGVALATARQRGRTPKAKAAAVVRALLQRAQALLHDDLAPRKVSRIWLFGSFIDPDKSDVGDIDVVVECYSTDVVPFDEVYHHVVTNYPGLISENADFMQRLSAGEQFLSKSMYGARRHPLLAPNDIGTLISLHRPCALFFDQSRGGIIEPEYHPHHPESPGRGETIRERLELPDLASHDDLFRLTPPIVVDRKFSPGAARDAFHHLDWRPSKGNDISDSFRFTGWHGAIVDIERRVDFHETFWELTMSVTIVSEGESHLFQWDDVADKIVWLAHADVIRLAEYRNQRHSMQEIFGDIDVADALDDHPLKSSIIRRLDWSLNGWGGRPGLPDSHAFGIELSCDCNGPFRAPPHEFDDDEWEEAAHTLPFTREQYMAWARPHLDEEQQHLIEEILIEAGDP
ncbi:hypothetical protein [Rhizobium leguminosarum]|uniref:hypothetical protein n=1 Tax=Rhizobium leguminosarum TaxID=384 RepID=UPI002E0DCA93|nr:hypothetical protein U8Q02_43185 [Rhizobium leguminosarum]